MTRKRKIISYKLTLECNTEQKRWKGETMRINVSVTKILTNRKNNKTADILAWQCSDLNQQITNKRDSTLANTNKLSKKGSTCAGQLLCM